MPATMTAESRRIALHTSNPADRIALRGVRLRGRVAGMSLKATIEQTFVNLEDRAIEALYTFPLPEEAAVCGFEVVFFDKVFTGVVDEAEQAIQKYEQAISQGHGAYLLEQHRPDVFSVRVGNLKPRQAVTIRLSYVMDLMIVDRSIRLSFPTTIAPRYVTSSGMDPIDAAVDGDALNPPHVLSVPFGLSMELEVDLGQSLEAITSPSHAITVQHGELETVTFTAGLSEMNRDVVLQLDLRKEQQPFALAATSDRGERFVAVNFVPEFDEEDATGAPGAAETVFLLDCSGSMQGPSIQQAVAALECCLRSMNAGDHFNICRFGSTYELLSPEPLVYSQDALAKALQFIHHPADLGGTELLAPLEAILNGSSTKNRPGALIARNIVLLTDGQVSNEPAILALAKRKRSTNRIFTFGIGSSSSAFLVKGLARMTNGAAEFISEGERIEDKVLRTFGRIGSLPVTNVEIEWNDADAQIAPRQLPPIFDGDALRVFARLPGRIPQSVTLRCQTPIGPKFWSVQVREAKDSAKVLPTLWARATIRAIEEENQIQPTAIAAAASAERTRLIELSKQYNLLCSLTSFIAVEHRSLEDRNEGRPELRRVPIALAEGWGGVETVHRAGGAGAPAGAVLCAAAAPPQAPAASFGLASRTLAGGIVNRFAAKLRKAAPARHFAPPPPPATSADIGMLMESLDRGKPEPGDSLIDLLSEQTADGSFDVPETANRLLTQSGRDPAVLTALIDDLLAGNSAPSTRKLKFRETLLVLLALRLLFADRRSTWSRADKKAQAWITSQANLAKGQVQQWLDSLEKSASAAKS